MAEETTAFEELQDIDAPYIPMTQSIAGDAIAIAFRYGHPLWSVREAIIEEFDKEAEQIYATGVLPDESKYHGQEEQA